MRGALLALLLLPPAAAKERPVDAAVEADRRVEIVSVLLRLAEKAPAATEYQREADAHFGKFAAHPLVAATKELADSDPHANPALRAALEPGRNPAYRKALAAFEAESGFERFWRDHQPYYRESARRAGESGGESPAALAAYLGKPLSGRYRFVPAGLLPAKYETNLRAGDRWYWIHSGTHPGQEGEDFMFVGVGNGLVHELSHTVLDDLPNARPQPPGAPPKGCNDNAGAGWTRCIQEHLAYAVTIRLRAKARGEAEAALEAKDYQGRGFPFLEKLCARLKEYEGDRKKYPTLESFYPRLEAVFKG